MNASNNENMNFVQKSKEINILVLPDEILDTLLSYTTYDEVSRLRLVCKKFDSAAQRVLNQGFYKVEKYHAQCLRKVKEQLPRRESERRKHPLSVHCDILTSIETRLSLLGMTFMKYVELKYCCFIPGKVLDEIFKILRYVSTVTVPPRAHDILLELRDISSMAMEHFDEQIAPIFRARSNSTPKLAVTSYGTFTNSSRSTTSSNLNTRSSLVSSYSRLDSGKCGIALKQLNVKYLEMKKENSEVKRKLAETRRKVNELDRRLHDQNNILTQKNTRLAEQERKASEMERKLLELTKELKELKKAVSGTSHRNNDDPVCTSRLGDKLKDKEQCLSGVSKLDSDCPKNVLDHKINEISTQSRALKNKRKLVSESPTKEEADNGNDAESVNCDYKSVKRGKRQVAIRKRQKSSDNDVQHLSAT